MFQKWLAAVVLGICTYTDIKQKKVYRDLLILYGVIATLEIVILQLLFSDSTGYEHLLGCIPGILCILISLVTKEALGYGDSILILLIGWATGWNICFWMCVRAIFMAGIWSILLCIRYLRKPAHRPDVLPFVPFLALGFVMQWIGG